MENKKIKNATPLEFDGIKFKSKLEVMAYKTLKEDFEVHYEPTTYKVWEGFKPTIPFYDKDKDTKALKLNDKKIIDIKYTPDFLVYHKNILAFVELKGIQNDTYYLKKKLFRGYLESIAEDMLKEHGLYLMYFEVYTKKQLLQAIEIIKNYDSSRENK